MSSNRRRRPFLEPDEVDFLLQTERSREEENEERLRTQQEQRQFSLHGALLGLIVIFSIFTIILYIIVLRDHTRDPMPVAQKDQGAFGAAASRAFVDDQAIDIVIQTMMRIDADCRPPSNGPAMTELAGLTPSQKTNSKLTELFGKMRQEVQGTCEFYGIAAAEFRTGATIGPSDICHGYVHAGLTALIIRDGPEIPLNFKEIADFIYFKAYPLNIFWPFVGVPSANIFEGLLLSFLRFATENADDGGLEITRASVRFCNQFFVESGNPNYYNNRTQPWLGFPFPGSMQRTGHNHVAPVASQVLANFSLSSQYAVRKVYTFGDVLDDAGVRLFVDSALGTIDKENFPDPDITENFRIVYNSITDDVIGFFIPDTTPIFILGRWAQDASAYSSFADFGLNILYGVTDVTSDPQGNSDINVNVTEQTRARDSMNVLDFNTTLPYESIFGDAFIREMHTAEIIATVIRNQNSIKQTVTYMLEDTFAIKNVMINDEDIGVRAKLNAARELAKQNGFGSGFLPPAYSIALITDVQSEPAETFGSAPLPQKFDWRESRPECIGPIINQGGCNSCWAVATGDALGSRVCVEDLVNSYGPVSVQHITSCAGHGTKDGCAAGAPQESFTFTGTVGAVDSRCFPYTNSEKLSEVNCKSRCKTDAASSMYTLFESNPNTHVQLDNIDTIKRELFDNGPLTMGFHIPADLCDVVDVPSTKRTAVYKTDSPTQADKGSGNCGSDAHLVMLVGWDDTAPDPYWILKNSWRPDWADNGYFRVKQNMFNWRASGRYWFEDHAYTVRATNVKSFGQDQAVPAPAPDDPTNIVNEDQAPRPPTSGSTPMAPSRLFSSLTLTLLLTLLATVWLCSFS